MTTTNQTKSEKEYVPYGINGEYFIYSNIDNCIPLGMGSIKGTKKFIQRKCDELNLKFAANQTTPVKDELLDIKYYVDGGDYQRNNDPSEVYVRKEKNGEQFDVCNLACNDEPGNAYENALIIKTALANTYGKGYNPAAMDELYKALERAKDWFYLNVKKLDGVGAPACFPEILTALQNAKL